MVPRIHASYCRYCGLSSLATSTLPPSRRLYAVLTRQIKGHDRQTHHFHTIQPLGQSKSTKIGSIFDTLPNIDSLNTPPPIPEEPQKHQDQKKTPRDYLSNLTLSEVLPPNNILKLFLAENRIDLPLPTQRAIVSLLVQHYTDFYKSPSSESLDSFCVEFPDDLSMRIMSLAQESSESVRQLAFVISKHSAPSIYISHALYGLAYARQDLEAGYAMSRQCIKGLPGLAPDPAKGYQILHVLSGRGHGRSMYTLGCHLFNVHPKKGVELLTAAAGQDVKEACTQLGHLYLYGNVKSGVLRNLKTAETFLLRASKLGHPEGSFYLSTLYSSQSVIRDPTTNGNNTDDVESASVAVDDEKAFGLLVDAAMKGLPVAQFNVGVAYFEGRGTKDSEKDIFRATEYWKMASEGGVQLAQINLAKLYKEGHESSSLKPDLTQSKKFLMQCRDMGGPLGQEASTMLEQVNVELRKVKESKGWCGIM